MVIVLMTPHQTISPHMGQALKTNLVIYVLYVNQRTSPQVGVFSGDKLKPATEVEALVRPPLVQYYRMCCSVHLNCLAHCFFQLHRTVLSLLRRIFDFKCYIRVAVPSTYTPIQTWAFPTTTPYFHHLCLCHPIHYLG